MENGNKKFKTICIILFLVCFLVSCGSESVFKEEFHKNFFSRVLIAMERDEINVKSVDVYYYDNTYYYKTDYSFLSVISNQWEDIELVYFGNGHSFSLVNTAWTDDESVAQKETFNEAVLKGDHKSFTTDEIRKYIDDCFESDDSK